MARPGKPSKDKNDRKDAERLAKLLYLGELPTVHVPSIDVRTWRELINCRSQVVAKRTRAKNAIRALLRSNGVAARRRPSLWTKEGMAWLRELTFPTFSQALRRDLLLEEIEALTRHLQRIERELNSRADKSPAVLLLRSISGVGIRTAEAIAAFIDDPHRFLTRKRLRSTSVSCPGKTSPGTRIGSGISHEKGLRSFDGLLPKRLGKRGVVRQPSTPISSR